MVQWGVVGGRVEKQPGVREAEPEVRTSGSLCSFLSHRLDQGHQRQWSQGHVGTETDSYTPCQASLLAVGLHPLGWGSIFFLV